ncbi:diacylglycerol/lipid kinase family protein [Bacillus testis]|uniref:diacylglycerol/lipid kinase family protein n=1 Tax=Bacillus testis TaxID=1622072 RepID=UPI00067F55C2|nr:diacylglycerol kinase family protein [Bacillus testis]
MKWKNGLILYNGSAGQKAGKDLLGVCMPILSPEIEELTVMPTKEQGDAERICREKGGAVDVLFILGGDGTVHECINGLAGLKKRPVVGILPGGTCNDFSRELNISQNIEEAAKEMLAGEIREIDIGQVDGRYFLNFLGLGLIADTSTNIDSGQKNMLGKVSYFLSAIKTVKQADTFTFKMEYDGEMIVDEAVLILVGNGRYIGTYRMPFKKIDSSDGKLDIVIVKNSNLAVFKDILFGNEYEEPHERTDRDIIYLQARSIKIETSEEKDIDTDGEIYMKTPLSVNLLPNHIPFLCQTDE